MTIVGAQDFQSGEQWQSQLLGNFSQFLVGGASHTWPDTGPVTIAVANWQGTQVKVNAASAADWVFKWWADAAGTFQLGERRFTTSTTFTDTYLTLANLGPYVTVTATNGAAGNNTASAIITGTNRILAPFQPGASGPMILADPTTVGGAATVNVLATYLYAGPAYIRIVTGAAAWVVSLGIATSNGVFSNIGEWSNVGLAVTQQINQQVILPPRPVRLTLINQDAGAQNFRVALTPDMFR